MLKLQSWAWQGGELFDRVTHVKRFTEMDALTPETLQGGTASWSYTVFKYLLSFRWVMDLYVTIASAQAADAIEQMLLALNYIHSHGLWAQRVALGIMFFSHWLCFTLFTTIWFWRKKLKQKQAKCWSLQQKLPSKCRLKFITLQILQHRRSLFVFQIGSKLGSRGAGFSLRHCAPRSEAGKFPAPFWKLAPSEKHSIAAWSSVMVAKWFYNSIIHSINGVYWLLMLGLHTGFDFDFDRQPSSAEQRPHSLICTRS